MNVRLFGFFVTKSPLSHISESISTQSFLAEQPILQPDGSIENVATISGNSWRGQLRDLAAVYMLEHLGNATVPLEAFHLLFSGGRIGGAEMKTDIAKARQLRKAVPLISIFGGGISNMIMPGKLRISDLYPVCQEALPALPDSLADEAAKVSYRGLTFDRSFTRTDDAKNPKYSPHIQSVEQLLLAGEAEPKKREGPADQMRMTCELLIAGVRLYTEIECLDMSEVELGCLVSALHSFSRSPHIGGQANRGHGRVRLDYRLLDLDTGAEQDFLRIGDGPARLAPPAEAAKTAYDRHLADVYDRLLAEHGGEIRALLGAA